MTSNEFVAKAINQIWARRTRRWLRVLEKANYFRGVPEQERTLTEMRKAIREVSV